MLQSIRDGLQRQKWITWLVLGALALIFGVWGASGITNFSATGGATYAAEANGRKVSAESARTAWLNQQAQYQKRLGGDIPAEQKRMLQDNLLESMIREVVLTGRAVDLGYRVTDDDVSAAIQSEPAFQIEGKYNAGLAKERLSQAGISEQALEGELRDGLQRAQLQRGIVVSDFLTAAEVQRTRALQNEQREIRFVLLPAEKFSANLTIDDAAIEAYYKGHQADYMNPESVHLGYAELRLDQLAAQVTPGDADIRAAYEKNKSRYVEPERRHARHILIAAGKDDAAAHALADKVMAEVKAGGDFAALAKKYSQDPGSADKGGDLGWADRTQFVGPFADAMFAMNLGEIKGPVKTEFGYHILRLDEIQPGKEKTLEAVRPELEAELKRNAAADRFGEIQEQIQTRLQQSNADLDGLVKQFHLQPGDIAQFQKGAGGAPLGIAQGVQDLVFGDSALQPGRIGGPVMVGEDRLVLVQVLDRRKAQPRPLAEVRDSIVAALRKQRGSQLALQAAQDAEKKLQSGTPFDDIVKQLNVTSEPARFVGRKDPTIPAQLRDTVFNSPKPVDRPVFRSVALQTGGAVVVAVTAIRADTPAGSDKEQEAARAKQQTEEARQLALLHGEGDVNEYVEEARRTADVRKNLKVFD